MRRKSNSLKPGKEEIFTLQSDDEGEEKDAFAKDDSEEEDEEDKGAFASNFKFDFKSSMVPGDETAALFDDIVHTFDMEKPSKKMKAVHQADPEDKERAETTVFEQQSLQALIEQSDDEDDGRQSEQFVDMSDDEDGADDDSDDEDETIEPEDDTALQGQVDSSDQPQAKDELKDFMTSVKKSNTNKDEEEEPDELENENFDKKFFRDGHSEQDSTASSKNRTFNDMNLSRPLLKAVDQLGFKKPTPIQERCIPVTLRGHDICASAVTGSGKTAAFLLPIMERLLYRDRSTPMTRVLILLPTRELARQCFQVSSTLAQHTDIRCCLITGGKDVHQQREVLLKYPDIVIATPGRVVDHLLNTPDFTLEHVEILVLDEADRLLELGFEDELEQIVKESPKNRQTMLFSATMTDDVTKLVKLSLQSPVRVAIGSRTKVADNLRQEFIKIKNADEKEAILLSLCTRTYTSQGMVFANTKQTVQRLRMLFYLRGLKASELHSNISQEARAYELDRFANKLTDFLICTDVAARGLDIKGVQLVVNYDMPKDLKTYIHRVGRTARAGAEGIAVSCCSEENRKVVKRVVKRAKLANETVTQRIIPMEAIRYWKSKIEDMEPKLKLVNRELYEQKQMNRAAKDLEKAEQILQSDSTILTEPRMYLEKTAKKYKVTFDTEKNQRLMEKADEAEESRVKTRREAKLEKKMKQNFEKMSKEDLVAQIMREEYEQIAQRKKRKREAQEPDQDESGRAKKMARKLKSQMRKGELPKNFVELEKKKERLARKQKKAQKKSNAAASTSNRAAGGKGNKGNAFSSEIRSASNVRRKRK